MSSSSLHCVQTGGSSEAPAECRTHPAACSPAGSRPAAGSGSSPSPPRTAEAEAAAARCPSAARPGPSPLTRPRPHHRIRETKWKNENWKLKSCGRGRHILPELLHGFRSWTAGPVATTPTAAARPWISRRDSGFPLTLSCMRRPSAAVDERSLLHCC